MTSQIPLLTTGDWTARIHILMAHGAGSPMDSPFQGALAGLLAERGLCAHRFEFGYMRERRDSGKRRPPPKADRLCEEYEAALAGLEPRLPDGSKLLAGGKSMGGRVASLIADRLYNSGRIHGLVCFGYPFHPPNELAAVRTAHLMTMTAPALILQGERDPFGSKADVTGYALPGNLELVWLDDGDHDFGPRGKSPATRAGNLENAANAVRDFASKL